MERYNKIIELLNDGWTVYFATAYKITKVTKKHIHLLSSDQNGHIYIRGIDYTYCGIKAYK